MKSRLLVLAALLLAPVVPMKAGPLSIASCDAGSEACRGQVQDCAKGGGAQGTRQTSRPDNCTGGHAAQPDPDRRFWREKRRKVFEPDTFDGS
ncbi:hypothetical protein [Paludibacterium yongneupense]|uniref:hypothetical protein n=1 Tax=Paludibacterium yongneupense TaxID=400061 RepID=UPI0012EB4D18|nr:hypothetical protein [Paludibacterium yongneupense]